MNNKGIVRRPARDLATWGETLRNRIQAGKAVDKLNGLITGEITDMSRVQFDAIKKAIDKCLPDLKAVQVVVTQQDATTKADIDAMLMEAGLNPDTEYTNERSSIEGECTKVDSEE